MNKQFILISILLFFYSIAFSKPAKEIQLPEFSEKVMKQGAVKIESSKNCVLSSDTTVNKNSVTCSTNKNLDTSTKVQGYTGETSSFMQAEKLKYDRKNNP